MRGQKNGWFLRGVLTMTVVAGSLFSAEPPVKYVNTHSFWVQVSPDEKDARDAVAAELFISRFPENGWLNEGTCEIAAGDNQGKIFSRTVRVPNDGVYYFTSRGVDRIGAGDAPKKGDAAQVKVVADTTVPQVKIITPQRYAIFRSGEKARIDWTAVDANLALNGIDLYYSPDGKIWKTIAANQPNTGHYEWQIPPENFYLRITARDYAGNVGGDESPEIFKVMIGDTSSAVIAETKSAPSPVVEERKNSTPSSPVAPVFRAEAITTGKLPAATQENVPELNKENPADVQSNASAAADKYLPVDPRPLTKHPQLDANNGEIPMRAVTDDGKSAYIAYVMGGNLVRQGRWKDSLRYFRSAVDIDPNFDEAWNDMALVYKQLGAFTKADACIVRALKIEPNSPRYLNTRGAIYQMAGMEILRDPASADESLARANDLILFAVKTFGWAIDEGLRRGALAERAETYFHLGEICYFANQDPTGARQYWLKVLDLHTPTPNLDEVMLDRDTMNERLTRSIYEKNTELWVNLKTWQEWAREYIRQLNDLERGVALPRSPFNGTTTAQFGTFGLMPLGAGTAPIAASPEVLTLLPDGSYATTQPGYTVLAYPQTAASNQPQVQVINNYLAPSENDAANNSGTKNRMRNKTENAPVNNAYSATHYYEENKAGYYESYQQEIYGKQAPAQTATSAAASDRVYGGYPDYPNYYGQSRASYNQNNGYNYHSVPPAPQGRGQWFGQNYGSAPGYTYQAPRTR